MGLNRDELVRYLEEHARVDLSDAQDDTELFSSGLVDSFAMVDLLVFLEKHTGAALGPEDISLENFDTLERILAFAQSKARS